MLNFLKITSVAFLCSACIQLPVGPKKVEQYKNVQYNEPSPHFTLTTEFSADRAWINKSTGSIISYKSECSSGSQNTELFLQNITNEFYPAKTSAMSTFKYNSRKALRQRIKTEIEGIPTAFDLVVFKKYGCLFLMSHSGVFKSFTKTENVFEQFLDSFKVQR